MILVTGAAGKTGKAVITSLINRGEACRAFVRSETQAHDLQSNLHCEIIIGDLRNPHDIEIATRNINSIYFICPNVTQDELDIGKSLARAAKLNGVSRFVYHSVLHPQIESMPHHWQKLRMEEFLFTSGLDFTILQPCAYMQNVLGSWKTITNDGKYIVPYLTETRISIIDLKDIGETAAIVLTEAGHSNAIYEIAGPEPLSQNEVAKIIAEVIKINVIAESISRDTWRENAKRSGMPDYQLQVLVNMFEYYEKYGLIGSPFILCSLLKREPTFFSDFLRNQIFFQEIG